MLPGEQTTFFSFSRFETETFHMQITRMFVSKTQMRKPKTAIFKFLKNVLKFILYFCGGGEKNMKKIQAFLRFSIILVLKVGILPSLRSTLIQHYIPLLRLMKYILVIRLSVLVRQ